MPAHFAAEQRFNNIDFKKDLFEKGEYDSCDFFHCDFSNTDISGAKFLDCRFTDCNLSMAGASKTSFQDVYFKNCKLLGFQFDLCSPFGLSLQFENCLLDHASFTGTKIKDTRFLHTRLHGTDFTGTDLTGVLFFHCDLSNAVFENTILLKADFRTAFGYSFDPEINRLKGAQFSLPAVTGLLTKYGIKIDE